MAVSDQAQATPLTDLLLGVPSDHRTEWVTQLSEDGTPTGHEHCPIGSLCHEAAERIEELEAENLLVEALRDDIREYKREIDALKEWQIDAKRTLAVIKGGFDALARLDLLDSGDPQEVTDSNTPVYPLD